MLDGDDAHQELEVANPGLLSPADVALLAEEVFGGPGEAVDPSSFGLYLFVRKGPK